jgi:hypothetical protein
VGGSRLYGVAGPDSDLDLKYVFVRPTKDLIGLRPPVEKKETVEGVVEFDYCGKKVEFVAHEIGKFARLLLKGNPNLVEYLWSPGDETWADGWTDIRREAKRFLSQQTVKQYSGYCGGQLKRLQNSLSLHTTGGQYNTKWAYHMVRLMWTAGRIANGEEPKIRWDGEQRDTLLEIRAGGWSSDRVIQYVRERLDVIDGLDLSLTLPEHGDKEWLNDWLLRQREQFGG